MLTETGVVFSLSVCAFSRKKKLKKNKTVEMWGQKLQPMFGWVLRRHYKREYP